MEVACLACEARLIRSPSHARTHVFCSIPCRRAYHRRPVKCRGCGLEFPRDPKQPQKAHCSRECFKASRHTTAKCSACSTDFVTYVSEQAKREARGHAACCSRACRNVRTSKLLGGDGAWTPGGGSHRRRRSPEWRRNRLAYLVSVGHACEACGERATDVHHLFPTAMGGDLLSFDNMMASCRACHRNMHAQIQAGAFAEMMEVVRARA